MLEEEKVKPKEDTLGYTIDTVCSSNPGVRGNNLFWSGEPRDVSPAGPHKEDALQRAVK